MILGEGAGNLKLTLKVFFFFFLAFFLKIFFSSPEGCEMP